LRFRTNTFGSVFRIRHSLAFAVHQFFNDRGFLYLHTPIITSSDAEGAGEMFRVTTLPMEGAPKNEAGEIDFTEDFFGKSTNLTVSGQLGRRARRHGLFRHLHFWSNLPRREFKHHKALGRVLDD
jgi:asparaginyl-tRNA synthetase